MRLTKSMAGRSGVVALVVVASSALPGCWETDAYDRLYVRNDSDVVVGVQYEWSSGERLPLLVSLEPGEEQRLAPPVDPEVDGVNDCTTGPLIVLRDGEEIQRFEPVCYGDGLTLVVDGQP